MSLKAYIRIICTVVASTLVFIAGAQAQRVPPPLYLSFEQRLQISLAIQSFVGTKDQMDDARTFAIKWLMTATNPPQVVKVNSMEEFLTAWRGPWPGTQSLDMDLFYLNRLMPPFRRTFVGNNKTLQRQIDNYISSQPQRIGAMATGLASGLAQMVSTDNLLRGIVSMIPIPGLGGDMSAMSIKNIASNMVSDLGNEASALAGDFIDQQFKDLDDASLKIAIKKILVNYYVRISRDSQKQILSGLLGSNLEADTMERFAIILQNSGPQLQKLLQLVGQQDNLPPDVMKILKVLESGVRQVPWIQVQEIIANDKGGFDFESVEQSPLGVGTMAQVHRAVLRGKDGKRYRVVVRFIKPGMADRVNEDELVLQQIAKEIDADPVYRAAAPPIGPIVGDLSDTVRAELSLPATIARQVLAYKAYSKDFAINFGGKLATLHFRVPFVFQPPPGVTSQLHVQEAIDGQKIDSALKGFPDAAETKRQMAEDISKMFFQELLYGSGLYHSDLHQGNSLLKILQNVSGMTGTEINYNILDFGMGGQLTRDVQQKLILLNASFPLNKGDKIADLFWSISQISRNEISKEDFTNAVLTQTADLKSQGIAWDTNGWSLWVVNRGLALPYDLINLNRGIAILDKMLKNVGSTEGIGGITKKVVEKNLFKTVKLLLLKGHFSLLDLYRLGFPKQARVDDVPEEVQRNAQLPDPIPDSTGPVTCKSVFSH